MKNGKVRKHRFRKLIKDWDINDLVRWLGLALIIGVIAGLGAIIFVFLSNTLAHYALGVICNYHPSDPANKMKFFKTSIDLSKDIIPWLIILVPTAGGLICGLIVQFIAPECGVGGIDTTIDV